MTITVVMGSQFGDEGKGKLTDILAPKAQLCARAAGGHNAGHKIFANGVSYSFHLLPSGLINPSCMNLIGADVVFYASVLIPPLSDRCHVLLAESRSSESPSFFKELQELEDKGLKGVRDKILVSDRCHIVLDLHVAVDGLEEVELGARQIGTTRRGIGPTYSCKHARNGIRLAEIFDPELFERKLRQLEQGYRKRFGDLLVYDMDDELKRFETYRADLAKYTVDSTSLMYQAQQDNKSILVEGANFVTSSSTTIAGIINGLSLNPRALTEVIGVVKAYTTRVGAGAFKTEDTGEVGTKLQEIGHEWGTSTGRRRRCGWLDLVIVRYSNSVNYYDSINLTKLDVLDTFETIKVAVAYKLDGEELSSYPADLDALERAEVVYKEFPGWQKSTTSCRTWYDLPQKARNYVEFIEKFIGVKIKWIGTGPDREAMITRA
ncbi:P-loop containing nucleoside triphosphate hydrolase protein [Dactylonectria macrodidyma]|uniref:Adenylosuccinate synthetase n=1 Tax=Dactylonectria macrodidyma TaxID=307937 RepID=A0A9P9DQ12_9HYPO|nr:P-loop containing nucleoside triphosphate hydrolase protein [Dactylonectria macrodidyma]